MRDGVRVLVAAAGRLLCVLEAEAADGGFAHPASSAKTSGAR
jgi:hypothetical protein